MSQRPRSTAAGPGPVRLAEWIGLGAILLGGLLIRASYFSEIVRAPDFAAPPADGGYHDYWARALVTGNWTPPEGQADPEVQKRPFARPPGYPYFLALIYALGGPDFQRPRVVKMAIGLASVIV